MIEWAINNPILTFIIVIIALCVVELIVSNWINRNKPVVSCACNCCENNQEYDDNTDNG